MRESRYIPGPLAMGTVVKFRRAGRERGQRTDWIDSGRVKKVDVYSYVIENEAGELYVRRFDEVDRLNGTETE